LPDHREQSGFALLEVIVAFTIAAIALAVLFHGALQGLNAASVAGRYEEAIALARSHLAASGLGPAAGDREGDDGSGYHWHVRVRNAGTAKHQAGDANAPNAASPVTVNLFAITVWESWQDDGNTRDVRLDTERLATALPH
jgi:general secretion pathway protein I